MELDRSQLNFINEIIAKKLNQTQKEMQNLENNIQVMEDLNKRGNKN